VSAPTEPITTPRRLTVRADDQDTFQQLAEPFRRELQLHCYRMLGSFQEAEDLVQETFLRAWRARDRFEGRMSFRNWLYRIATNACLNALAKRPNRSLPELHGQPSDRPPEGLPASDIAWLEPYPDAAIEGIRDTAPGPEARYELREAVQLAFVAAIQQLPPRQRAVLLLRDVLGWSASDTARLLDTSVVAVNGAVRRARATLETRLPTGRPDRLPSDAAQRTLLERYVRAWEEPDLSRFVTLLKEDAMLRMPP
jgi:RNA polymerase sigma-70 factor (ECF subfamily)